MTSLDLSTEPAAKPTATYAFALLVLTGCLLALAVLLSKLAATQAAPMLWYLAAAMGGSGLILTVDALRRGEAGGRPLAILGYSLGAGALMALGSMLGYLTVGRVGAAFLALAMAFPTLFTYVLSLVLGMDKLQPLRLLGVAAGMSGGLWLALAKGGQSLPADLPAVIAASAMPLVLAIGNVYRTRYWPREGTPRLLAGVMLLMGAVVTVPIAWWHDGPATLATLWTRPALAHILVVAILSFTLQYLAFFRLQQIAGPVYLSQIGSVAAVVGSLVAVVVFGESLPSGFIPAAACIALGIAFFQISASR